MKIGPNRSDFFHQNQVVPFQQPQVSTIEIENQTVNLSRSVRIRNQAVQFNNWIQNSQTMETAKRMLSVNIPTMIVLLITIPNNIMVVYVYLSGSCEEDNWILVTFKVSSGLSLLTYLAYLFVANIKLENMIHD